MKEQIFGEFKGRELEEFNNGDSSEYNVRCGEVWYLGCCDCGLMHQYVVDIIGENSVRIRFVRDESITKQSRRKFRSRFPVLEGGGKCLKSNHS